MNKLNSTLIALSLFVTFLITAQTPQKIEFKNNSNTLAFRENKGQVHDQYNKQRNDVLFSGNDGNMTFHLRKNGISYQLNKIEELKEMEQGLLPHKKALSLKTTVYRVDITWLNINSEFNTSTDEALSDYENYYYEGVSALNVKRFKGVSFHNIYHGIDLHYYQQEGKLKYDYIVKPYIDYKTIKLKIAGAEIKGSPDGGIILKTPLGTIKEERPIVYQRGKELKARWVYSGNVLSFEIDGCNSEYELIIDPIARIWGTYYGESNWDEASQCTADANGNVYMTGYTNASSGSALATSGSHQTSFGGGTTDGFLVKFNGSGVRQWATYYGGTDQDYSTSCASDANGNVFIAGYTLNSSGSAIATSGSHQDLIGGSFDAFLVKFNSAGIRQWGTYYGGSSADFGMNCCTDINGNIFLTGNTLSTGSAIATLGSHQSTIAVGNGQADAFLVKFNSSGVRQWGTYYGGTGDDFGTSCSADPSGNIFLFGQTESVDLNSISTNNSHQPSLGGPDDMFLAKFDQAGVRQWGTYYGTLYQEFPKSCAADALGNIYIVGIVPALPSSTILVTTSAYQPTIAGGGTEACLVKFDGNGVRQWGTFYGGIYQDQGYGCATDAGGNVYMCGYTEFSTSGAMNALGGYQNYIAGHLEGFLVKFNSLGVRQWATFYGGDDDELASSCATNNAGEVFMCGGTRSNIGWSIASPGSHQQSLASPGTDCFLVKFAQCPDYGMSSSSNASICAGVSITFTASATNSANTTFSWYGPGTYSAASYTASVTNADTTDSGIYLFIVTDASGCTGTSHTSLTVNAPPHLTVNSGSICKGQYFVIYPMVSTSYTIQGGNSYVSPPTTTSYTVIAKGPSGCVATATSVVTVNPYPIISVSGASVLCVGETTTLTANGALTYSWSTGATNATIVATASATSNYSVSGIDANGCADTLYFSIQAEPCTGLNDESFLQHNTLTVYPNPSHDVFNFMNQIPGSQLEVFNVIGQLILHQTINSSKVVLNLENQTKGLYFYRLLYSSGRIEQGRLLLK